MMDGNLNNFGGFWIIFLFMIFDMNFWMLNFDKFFKGFYGVELVRCFVICKVRIFNFLFFCFNLLIFFKICLFVFLVLFIFCCVMFFNCWISFNVCLNIFWVLLIWLMSLFCISFRLEFMVIEVWIFFSFLLFWRFFDVKLVWWMVYLC